MAERAGPLGLSPLESALGNPFLCKPLDGRASLSRRPCP